MKGPGPRLSIVATSRNDDHGGNLRARMQAFADGLLEQAARHELAVELIMVDWNPPPDRPGLAETMRWNVPSGCAVRVITVPPRMHARLRGAAGLPLFQMIAKNVGIRRARADFVLATNVDLLFSDELSTFLAQGDLRDDRLYRIDRLDVPGPTVEQPSLDQRLAYAAANVLRINALEGTRYQATGEWALTQYPRWKWMMLEWKARLRLGDKPALRLHTNGCGDFTLMAKRRWHALRGYPEFETYSMHIDSIFCHQAVLDGATEEVLREPMRLYHMDHDLGSGWSREGESTLFDRLEKRGVPYLKGEYVTDLLVRMRDMERPIRFNGADWGLAGELLKETTLTNEGTHHGTTAG